MTSIAPGEYPFTVAVGTAAYPIEVVAGSAILETGPGSEILPVLDSVVVLITCTEKVLGS
jgi:hypothetical protein